MFIEIIMFPLYVSNVFYIIPYFSEKINRSFFPSVLEN